MCPDFCELGHRIHKLLDRIESTRLAQIQFFTPGIYDVFIYTFSFIIMKPDSTYLREYTKIKDKSAYLYISDTVIRSN